MTFRDRLSDRICSATGFFHQLLAISIVLLALLLLSAPFIDDPATRVIATVDAVLIGVTVVVTSSTLYFCSGR